VRWNALAIDTLMPWVKFTEQFDWQPPNVRWMMSFGKGSTHLVKRSVAAKAIKEGKAVPVERPQRHARPNAIR
jgi:hypothetical protein